MEYSTMFHQRKKMSRSNQTTHRKDQKKNILKLEQMENIPKQGTPPAGPKAEDPNVEYSTTGIF